MLALSSLPLSLCLSQPALRTAPTYARARPAVALLTELPPGFEDLMPAVVHHTPFSRHLFNAIMGYMAIDTTLFAAKIIKRRMEPGVQEANRLAAAPATNFGALPPQPYFIIFVPWVGASAVVPCPPWPDTPRQQRQRSSHFPPLAHPHPPNPRPARHRHRHRQHPTRRPCPAPLARVACSGWVQADLRGPLPPLEDLDKLRVGVKGGHTLHLCRGEEAVGYASIERSLDFSEHYGASLYSHGKYGYYGA